MTPAENEIYIRPTLHIHPNLAAARNSQIRMALTTSGATKNRSAFQMPLWANATS